MASKIDKVVGLKKAIIAASLGFVALVCSVIAFIIGIDYTFSAGEGATGTPVGIILDLFVAWPISLLTLTNAVKSVKAANFEAKEGREKPKLTYYLGLLAVAFIVTALTLLIINLAMSCK